MPGLQNYLDNVTNELERAQAKHPEGFSSANKGADIVQSQVNELWLALDEDDLVTARTYAIRTGAMALRFLLDTEDQV